MLLGLVPTRECVEAFDTTRRKGQGCPTVTVFQSFSLDHSRMREFDRTADQLVAMKVKSILLSAADPQLLHLVYQRGACQPQAGGRTIGTSDHPVALLEGPDDLIALGIDHFVA